MRIYAKKLHRHLNFFVKENNQKEICLNINQSQEQHLHTNMLYQNTKKLSIFLKTNNIKSYPSWFFLKNIITIDKVIKII